MTVHTVERTAMARLKRIMPTGPEGPGREQRLPLHHELFLIAHDDVTGQRHIDEPSLARGLAAAVLLELWLTRQVQIGWRFDPRSGTYQAAPGRVSLVEPERTGDPILDSALTTLWDFGGSPQVRDFVKRFATTDVYERVAAHMIAGRTVHRATRRRFLFFRRETYLPVETSYSVRVRVAIRNLVDRHKRGAQRNTEEYGVLALANLVSALGLTAYLYPPNMSPARLQQWLENLIGARRNPTIHDVVTAVHPGRRGNPPAPR